MGAPRHHRVELGGGWPTEILFYRSARSRSPYRGWKLKVYSVLEDARRRGRFESFGVTDTIDFESRTITPRKIAKFVEAAMLRHVRHEIRETLRIDGRRVYPNPHRRKKRA